MTKEIQLTRGKIALIDDCDYESVSQYRWFAVEHKRKHENSCWYAIRYIWNSGKETTQALHSFIMQPPPIYQVDHINRNGLDCRRENLRVCTQLQNNANKSKSHNNTSGFKGVSWDSLRNKWRASIKISNKSMTIGRFNTAEEAARSYDRKAIELFGEFAYINFP